MYPLRYKCDVHEKFQTLKAFVGNERDRNIRALRVYTAGEYLSKNFSEHLSSNRIKHNLMVRYSPFQNALSEQMNRTSLKLVRSMFHSTSLLKTFWAEALNTAVYMH